MSNHCSSCAPDAQPLQGSSDSFDVILLLEKGEAERRAFALRALCPQFTTVLVNYTLCCRKPGSRPFKPFVPVESLEGHEDVLGPRDVTP